MSYIKEKLKKISAIVNIYENFFGGLHKLRKKAINRYKVIHFRMSNKTHFCYGDKNKDKTFFVISEENDKYMGLYSAIFNMLPYIEYAVKKKWIPIIDWKRVCLAFQDEDKKGKENAWEYYYEQPIKQYTLEEVYQSRHVIIKRDMAFRYKIQHPDWNSIFPANEKDLKRWNRIISSYIRLNSELENKVQVEQKRVFQDNRKVLGVGIRAGLRAGALRGGVLYNNHPKQPTCEELIATVEKKMKDWKCNALFVSSDDREYLNKFISRFGDKCLYIDRKLTHFFKDDIPIDNIAETQVEVADITLNERTKEYIIETYLLSQCHCLYSCIGGGAEFAYFLNGGRYEQCEVYHGGRYFISESNNKGKDSFSGYKSE